MSDIVLDVKGNELSGKHAWINERNQLVENAKAIEAITTAEEFKKASSVQRHVEETRQGIVEDALGDHAQN